MAKYCSLAMELTPQSSKDEMSALLSNRCLALISLKKLKEALADAKECITLKPQWFRVSSCLHLNTTQVNGAFNSTSMYKSKSRMERKLGAGYLPLFQ